MKDTFTKKIKKSTDKDSIYTYIRAYYNEDDEFLNKRDFSSNEKKHKRYELLRLFNLDPGIELHESNRNYRHNLRILCLSALDITIGKLFQKDPRELEGLIRINNYENYYKLSVLGMELIVKKEDSDLSKLLEILDDFERFLSDDDLQEMEIRIKELLDNYSLKDITVKRMSLRRVQINSKIENKKKYKK